MSNAVSEEAAARAAALAVEASMNPKLFSRYNRLSLNKKLELIETAEKGKSQRKLAEEFNISLGSVNKILKQKSEIISIYKSELIEKMQRERERKRDLKNDSIQYKPIRAKVVRKTLLKEQDCNNLKTTSQWPSKVGLENVKQEANKEYFSDDKLEKSQPETYANVYQEERLTSEGDEEEKSVSGSEGFNQMTDTIYSTYKYDQIDEEVDEYGDLNYEQVSQMLLKIRIFSTLKCPQLCNKIVELENEFNELVTGKEPGSDMELFDEEFEIDEENFV